MLLLLTVPLMLRLPGRTMLFLADFPFNDQAAWSDGWRRAERYREHAGRSHRRAGRHAAAREGGDHDGTLRCRVVDVAKLKNCRLPSSEKWFNSLFS